MIIVSLLEHCRIGQVVVLLDKAARRKVDIQPDYCALPVRHGCRTGVLDGRQLRWSAAEITAPLPHGFEEEQAKGAHQ